MEAYYALMKAYVLSPEGLAEEAALLASYGLDEITIMDSAGTMVPEQVDAYVRALKAAVAIPVGFHGHNNLGLAVANARAAEGAGADIIDCGLLGMARSAGNIPTEVVAALFEQEGKDTGVDVFGLLNALEKGLIPAMEKQGYRPPIRPLDLVYGISGAHSSFGKLFKTVATDTGVDLFKLINEVSKIDRKKPSEALIRQNLDREGAALLKHIRPGDRVICLCIRADAPDSVALSRKLTAWSGDGRRNVFVIGGSNGLSETVLARADERLSFSNLTFPHGLMRVILLEQLYRAERIRTGEHYHK